jgi:hypothetical protein
VQRCYIAVIGNVAMLKCKYAAGLDGRLASFTLVSLESFEPGEVDDTRALTGTVAVNGEGEIPFSL